VATIREVARRAGVSPITVSRVINDPSAVAEATRVRVEEAIKELKYVPNMLGQSLRHRRTHTIGLVIADIRNPYYVQVILAVEAVARDRGYDVLLVNTDGSADLEMRQLRNLVARQVDGIILAPIYNTPESVDFVQAQGIPICVMDYAMPDNEVDVVRSDTDTAATDLTRYVLSLGHRSLMMMTGPESIVTARERAAGYARAITEAGLSLSDNPIHYGSFDPSLSQQAAAAVLTSPTRPTAIVTASNFIALGVAHAARSLAIDIPSELTVVTFDAPATQLVLEPFFTCAETPSFDIAETAATILFQRIESSPKARAREVLLRTTMSVNRSSAAPPTTSDAQTPSAVL